MQILGIETSCDETAAAVVEEVDDSARPWLLRSNVVASQADIHREWGGVVPEIASRQHVRDICGVVERALEQAGTSLKDIDAIAVTQGPGLVGSLLVGVSFAKSLAVSRGLPLVPVHHLGGHIESLFLHNGPLPLPAVVLVVSGGHTSLYVVPEPGYYRLLGRTRDDAAGEAYDKVAKLVGLGYPGGPAIDRAARAGDDRAFEFPQTRITHADRRTPDDPGRLDFSFSGLKTAVLRVVRAREVSLPGSADAAIDTRSREGSRETGDRIGTADRRAPLATPRFTPTQGSTPFGDQEIADLCASFQRTVVETLLDRTFAAARRCGAASVGIAGGVSANSRLRADALARGEREGVPVFIPSLALSTDNAAMIAAAGLRLYHAGVRAGSDLNAEASMGL
jgi:N6-L-threonylcarbamoyladenine synthase